MPLIASGRMATPALLALTLLALTPVAQAIPEGPEYPSPAWFARDLANVARTTQGPAEQVLNPAFMAAWQTRSAENTLSWTQRIADDPSWLLGQSLNTPVTPLCTTWAEQCAGDPFRYPTAAGPDGAPFYESEAEVIPVVFYDRGCARLSGRVWTPRDGGARLPGIVIENGSIQAPEPIYWWAAQMLVRAGYTVMTFDPRGQGRSDQQTPQGEQGSNANSTVFWDGLVDAIDFFRSTPDQPYPVNADCAGTYPTEVTAHNPHHARIDPDRLGLAGHSLGATGVSVVQSYGAVGADPWPGRLDAQNPVDVIVAWDGLSVPGAAAGNRPAIVPRVPAMGQSGEYFLFPQPLSAPPDPEEHKTAFTAWAEASVPAFQFTIQGGTHFEWSLIPSFPSTSWCASTANGRCEGGWGNPMAAHYTLAWFDRWLKRSDEPGFADADARLLADADWQERLSFYRRSARDFPSRDGVRQVCDDMRAGCEPTASSGATPAAGARVDGFSRGGSTGAWVLAMLGWLGWRRARRQAPARR
ncbi:MAG: hypothetical protein ABF296_08850 [Oceanococcaceae bacterium]